MVDLLPGQLIFGRKSVAQGLKSTEQKIRTCVKTLENSNFLTIKSTNKFSIISIVNWETYQEEQPTANQQTNQQLTSSQPTTNHKQECKNKKEDLNSLAISREKEDLSFVSSASAAATPSPAAVHPSPQEFEKTEEDEEKPPKPAKKPPSQEFYRTKKGRKLTGKRLETFGEFWRAYDYGKGKAEAADSWLDIPELTNSLVATIVAAAEREAANRPQLVSRGGTPKWAQGWLTARRWEDEDVGEQRTMTLEEALAMEGVVTQ